MAHTVAAKHAQRSTRALTKKPACGCTLGMCCCCSTWNGIPTATFSGSTVCNSTCFSSSPLLLPSMTKRRAEELLDFWGCLACVPSEYDTLRPHN